MCKLLALKTFFAVFCVILSAGCNTGDDLSQPLPPTPPVSDFTFAIDSTKLILDEVCFVLNYLEDGDLIVSEFYNLEDDTVYLKGTQEPSGAIITEHTIFSPMNPAVGTSWLGEGANLFTVADCLSVTVPAGTFPTFIYQITDTATNELLGSLELAEDIGIVSVSYINGDDTTRLVLNDYTIIGGEGVFPLEVGNEWNLVEGIYEVE